MRKIPAEAAGAEVTEPPGRLYGRARLDPNGDGKGHPGVLPPAGPTDLHGGPGLRNAGCRKDLARGADEFLQVDRFVQQAVRPEFQQRSAKAGVIEPPADHEDWDVPNMGMSEPVLEETPAIHDGHLQVEKDKVLFPPVEPQERLGSIAGLDHGKTLCLEQTTIRRPDQAIIINDHQGMLGSHGDIAFLFLCLFPAGGARDPARLVPAPAQARGAGSSLQRVDDDDIGDMSRKYWGVACFRLIRFRLYAIQ